MIYFFLYNEELGDNENFLLLVFHQKLKEASQGIRQTLNDDDL